MVCILKDLQTLTSVQLWMISHCFIRVNKKISSHLLILPPVGSMAMEGNRQRVGKATTSNRTDESGQRQEKQAEPTVVRADRQRRAVGWGGAENWKTRTQQRQRQRRHQNVSKRNQRCLQNINFHFKYSQKFDF